MNIKTEQEMLEFGAEFGKQILNSKNQDSPIVIELIGDVGAGKTTFTRGLANGLGIKENITSPSFTISKSYVSKNGKTLTHYDFYRLSDPGLMSDDLLESINQKGNITVVEWADSIKNILPENHTTIEIKLNDDYSREVTIK